LPYLYDCLSDAALADTAAQALNWICGADLYDEVLVEEAVDEDELFPRELKAWRERGDAPRAADGKPFGTVETKLSTDAMRWAEWGRRNAGRFEPDLRYRGGCLYSPQTLIKQLAHGDTDVRLRGFNAHELVIRYGCDVPFETDMPVLDQTNAVERMSRWAKEGAIHFEAGAWYLHGQIQ
jgi:hypothetical protein